MGPIRAAVLSVLSLLFAAPAVAGGPAAEEVLGLNARLMLELVRHTPTYSPPVASRSFALIGIAAFEAVAQGDPGLRSLAGQVAGLTPPPARAAGVRYNDEAVLQATLAAMLAASFANTGPTGQRAMAAMAERLGRAVAEGEDPAVAARSAAQGEAVARHVLAWAATDGGAVVENMGFPHAYDLPDGPGKWVPTSHIVQQQTPLLPGWGANRPFAMPSQDACDLPPPLPFSVAPGSAFRAQAEEVLEVARGLTAEEEAIARFWADDAMLSHTPPGHWIALALQELEAEGAPVARRVELLAVLGVALADAFIACWRDKFRFFTVRPVTYIREHLDPSFQPVLITPPFPEFPSGHSAVSGAAAEVLTTFFGEDHAFTDRTNEADGHAARAFPSFRAAAEEAAWSRVLGGIHFREGIEAGLSQGRCAASHALRLETRR